MRVDVFLETARRLDLTGIPWWLSDGSALGCWRDGEFIDSDRDIDIGVWIRHIPVAAAVLQGESTRDRPHQLWRDDRGVKIDVHGHETAGDIVFFRLGKHSELRYEFPAFGLEESVFYGHRVLLPSPIETYLAAHYGDWQTPRAEWRWDRDPPCLRR